jgi:hypothetical protein
MNRLTRWLRRVVLAMLLIVCALWLTAYAREWLLRRRAERLLADIQALQVHQSTWLDAQRLITRWGAWGSYEGSCTSTKCDYSIGMSDSIPWEYHFPWEFEGSVWEGSHRFARMVDRLGLRASFIRTYFRVSKGVVTSKSFDAWILTPARYWDDPNSKVPGQLSAGVLEGPRLFGILTDTYYGDVDSVAGLYTNGGIFISSTPEEPVGHRQALMTFHLGCIDRWTPCLSQEELVPNGALEAYAR